MSNYQNRNDFQNRVSAKEIKEIEAKFLDFSQRDRNDSPAKCLTASERMTYADYLEQVKGDEKGAKVFREYERPKEHLDKKGKAVKTKMKEVELFSSSGESVGKVEVLPSIVFIKKNSVLYVQGSGKNKNRFYQTVANWNIEETDERLFLWQ